MSDYEIQFNVFDGSSGLIGDGFSASGHANVTFRDNITKEYTTIGANQRALSGGTVFRGLGATDDGIETAHMIRKGQLEQESVPAYRHVRGARRIVASTS